MVVTTRDYSGAPPGLVVRSGPARGGLALLLAPLEDDLDLERSDHHNEHQEKAMLWHTLSPDVKPAGTVPGRLCHSETMPVNRRLTAQPAGRGRAGDAVTPSNHKIRFRLGGTLQGMLFTIRDYAGASAVLVVRSGQPIADWPSSWGRLRMVLTLS